MVKKEPISLSADQYRERLEQLQARLNAAKIAYLNSTEFEGRQVTYEDLKKIAQEVIQTSYSLQKIEYGFGETSPLCGENPSPWPLRYF